HRGDGGTATTVVVDGKPGLGAGGPDRVVVLGVDRGKAGVLGDPGQQDAAFEARFGDPADLLDRRVDVVQEDLGDTGEPAVGLPAELGQPTVVGSQTGPALLEVVGAGGGGDQARRREERWDRVGEHD